MHKIDVMHWAIGANPVMVTGVGGWQEHTQPELSNIFDHFGVELGFRGGVRMARPACAAGGRAPPSTWPNAWWAPGTCLSEPVLWADHRPNAYEYDSPNWNP